ncbi:sigma-70 family RNA polymerase sigma factor [Rossellomorea sp. SC111]|uniref:sigma-70 family RNA polymerase sigma factor n=1 Tax=Rossellomorea sp. SC111 TaxID=2968985 RepID=UPI00215ACA65|nr:sigma-70 family RNA polymerase sigma factor [Rossellomorea sp. SC111]MCR8849451.1 sigma-70 family RNA polymerase sigma factor [Rossellomorea sp. SC111]
MNEDSVYEVTPTKDDLLEEVMSLYGKEVLYIAYSYVKDYRLAEDIAQEVFIRFYQGVDSFRNESSLKTWIIRIAINQSKDHLKKWETRKLLFTNKLHEIIHEFTNNPQTQALHKETSRELHQKLLSLSVKYREVLFLYYYEELKISEIAECLEININTAKTRLKTAKEKLKKMYPKGVPYDG